MYNTIVHLWTAGPFMDESTYQETMLANSNRKNNEDVIIVTTNMEYCLDDSVKPCETGEYMNSHGVKIVRLDTHKPNLKSKHNVRLIYKELCRLKPDFIMNHVFNPTSCMAIHEYKKKMPSCKVVADSHMTRYNSFGERLTIRDMMICALMRITGLICYKDIEKFYGITEQTVDMMVYYFGVPRDKTEYLPLGYNPEHVCFDDISKCRQSIRLKYRIPDASTIFITGGKLSPTKKTYELIRVFERVENAALIVFGDFSDAEYESSVRSIAGSNVIFTGALKSKEIYDMFLGSDIAVFPGGPSVLRQEAVACGVPIIMACNDDGDATINVILNNNGLSIRPDWKDNELLDSIKEVINEFPEYKSRAMELAQGEFGKYSYDRLAEYILNN